MTIDVDAYMTGIPNDLFRLHVILPAQHFNPPQKVTPEHRLMIGVLDDAVQCIQKHRFPASARARRLFDEATQWLLAREPRWPYSFECICAALDLDANAVRRRLLHSVDLHSAASREMQTRRRERRRDAVTVGATRKGTAPGMRSHVRAQRSSRTGAQTLPRSMEARSARSPALRAAHTRAVNGNTERVGGQYEIV